MKQYYDVYIRPRTGLMPIPFDEGVNVLDGFDRLKETKKITLTVEPEIDNRGDGTTWCSGFKIVFEADLIKVKSNEYQYLVDIYNNALCDIAMFDIENLSIFIDITGIRIKIEKILEKGESILVKISGQLKFGTEGIDNRMQIREVEEGEYGYGIIEGQVLDVDGMPLNNGIVELSRTCITDILNFDGQYIIMTHPTTDQIFAAVEGHSFQDETITIKDRERVIHNIREVES